MCCQGHAQYFLTFRPPPWPLFVCSIDLFVHLPILLPDLALAVRVVSAYSAGEIGEASKVTLLFVFQTCQYSCSVSRRVVLRGLVRLKWASKWQSLVMPNRKGCVPPLRQTEFVCFFPSSYYY